MRTSGKLVAIGSLTVLMATSAFADVRHQDRTTSRRDDDRRSSSSSYRDNDRVNTQGRITALSHERNGYRVQLDRSRSSYWVPDSYVRNRARDWRVGVNISLGGVFRGGSVYVDAVNWPSDGGYGYNGYNDGYLRGVVDRVDYRRNSMWIRSDSNGRMVEVVMRGRDRNGRLTIDDLNRGDFVELSGEWDRGGLFEAYRIDGVRNGRY